MNYDKNFCKDYVAKRKDILKEKISFLDSHPKLTIIQVGNNFASNKYVNGKIKDCDEVGILAKHIKLDESICENDLITIIKKESLCTNGIIVQLPLPKHIDVKNIQRAIPHDKDVDGFRLESPFLPCTPLGVFNLLNTITDLNGKNVVILGRSDIVGYPMATLLIKNSNATVTICNSHTIDLPKFTKQADIIISAIGKAKFVIKDMVKNNSIIIDVGINMDENGKMCGDVDYENVVDKCEFISPVPGGVGLITRLTLLENVVKSYELKTID